MKYPFTKALFRLKFPDLADNESQISTTQIVFLRGLNEKHPDEDQQRISQTFGFDLGRFVRRYQYFKYAHNHLNVRKRSSRRKLYLTK